MQGSEFVKSQLALRAWQDSDRDLSTMLACAFVIRNRVRAGFWNGDWLNVLSHHQDYAASERTYTPELPDPRNYAFGLFLQEIDGIFSGAREDDVTRRVGAADATRVRFEGETSQGVAMYYGRLHEPLRDWFLDSISRATDQHKLIATVGSLSFFS